MAEMEEKKPQINERDHKPAKSGHIPNNPPNDANLTISTKMSTDQLICKSPQESPSVSVKSLKEDELRKCYNKNNSALYLGILQVLFGFLMGVFGVLVIVHQASLSQLGGGIWGGCLAIATGVSGVLAAAREWCPLKSRAQRVAHTVFLALSLISIAISQLVVVLAATGLARDISSAEIREETARAPTETSHPAKISIVIPSNYLCLLSNIGLLIVAAIECICAIIASYKSSRDLCPCFRRNEETYKSNYNFNNSHALVSSWLGKHSPPPLYVVAAPASSLGKGSKLSGGYPVFAVPSPPPTIAQPSIIGYPLIPAPLGPVPSPIIPAPSRKDITRKAHKRYKSKSRSTSRAPTPRRSRSKSKSRERSVTEEDVVRTYTGLDRAVAEEFIDICDSRNTSLCSDISCTSSCQSPCNEACNTNSDAASQDYLVNKI